MPLSLLSKKENMATHHPLDLDPTATANDLLASSPRSEHHHPHDLHLLVRFMCSFGGKILPRPHDNLLRYVGGDTRIIAVQRATTFNALLNKLSKLSGTTNFTVKYQLPNEDLDALISVTTDEDVENMMEEYDRVAHNHNPRSARLRLFLFNKGDESRASSIGSLLDGSSNRDQWFLDALNGGGSPPGLGLERLRSETSSILSEVPDYLFGLETSEDNQPREPKWKARSSFPDSVSISDPGSPAPVPNSPYCSTSSACVPSMPDLPPVKTKPENPVPKSDPQESQSIAETGETIVVQPGGYPGNPAGYYAPVSHYSGPPMQPMPFYYIRSPMPPSNMSVPPIMGPGPYVQQYPASAGQVPIGYHQPAPSPGQVFGGVVRSVVADGMSHQVYYGVTNGGMVPTYPPGTVVPGPGGEDVQAVAAEAKPGRISQQS
ncbi:uncharacterized protein LOC115739831 [Rhodamnia argentea]|uniref:Uncharacterized protein LOC115739831 n=1 Tax=Rhodamnia argentea TaxID=178133 RepID=A0A8B8P2A9_9MYRT|nr:uncharacterized protein LOC115739831 [Rhodamnia argentea]XP_048141804.1 uncharacterized protein LOC115739831 [Rhodamnia argentea]